MNQTIPVRARPANVAMLAMLTVLALAIAVEGAALVCGANIRELNNGLIHGFAFLGQMFPPDWSAFPDLLKPAVDTIIIAVLGTLFGTIISLGFGLAAASNPDIVVFLDGDYSDRPAELPILLAPILDGRADITIGSRLGKHSTPGALPWHAAFGNHLAAFLIRRLYGARITDLGPFRAARTDVLRRLDLQETTYGWAVEMILKGALQGFRIVEVPVSYYPRIGKSKISGTLKGTVGAAWFILGLTVRYYFRHPKAGTSPAA